MREIVLKIAKKDSRFRKVLIASLEKTLLNQWWVYPLGGLAKHVLGPFPSSDAAKKWLRDRGERSVKRDGVREWISNNYAINQIPPKSGREIVKP